MKIIKNLSAVFFLIIISTLIGCDKKQPIPEEKFLEVYSDLTIAQDTSATKNKHQRDSVQQMVFSRYNITVDDYEKTTEYYSANPEKWETFFNRVIDSLEARKKRAAK
ncbi:MAG: DUF4296 domain-containing protein [Ignavibacteriales bacterium]|nr:MAG: DUF4296 domain-containing protein [Ignavibacteriales bacterium]